MDWLIAFSFEQAEKNRIKKEASLPNLQKLITQKKYSTIEEKMADIKSRIGFSLSAEASQEQEDADREKKKDLEVMKNILGYIRQMIAQDSGLDVSTVIARCKENDSLGFSKIRIDVEKLKSFIQGELDKKNVRKAPDSRYIPIDSNPKLTDQTADYFAHSRPPPIF